MITRAQALAVLGAVVLFPSCAARKPGTVRIASTVDASNEDIAEVYAIALERIGVPVERRMRLGDANAVRAAFLRNEIDVFPWLAPVTGPVTDYSQFGLDATMLVRAPARECETLATSQYVAQKLYLVSTEQCARLAPQLRLAATADFVAKGGMLSRLRAAYGGFRFQKIIVCDPGTQCNLLNRDLADVSHISNVDSQVGEAQLVLLRDEKHVWPLFATAPIIRASAIRGRQDVLVALNSVSRHLNLFALQRLNMRRGIDGVSAADAAEEFAMVYLKKR